MARSFLPREHGAYGQLGLPLVAALAARMPTLGAVLFAVAAFLLFFAHEPALVATGRRGQRVREQEGARALRWLWSLGAAGALLGLVALWRMPPHARLAAFVPAAAGIALGAFVAANREKTLPGELVAALAMSSAALPVAVADGVPHPWLFWAAWALGFASAVFPVRAVVVEHRRGGAAILRIAPTFVVIALAALILPLRLFFGTAPLFLAAAAVALVPPGMKQMTRAGWILMAAGILSGIALVAASRG